MAESQGGALAPVALALLFALGMPWIPAQAGGLGGSCCADVEERIAELEAVAARSGIRQPKTKKENGDEKKNGSGVVSAPPGEESERGHNGGLVISGTIARQLLFWDDGRDRDVYIVEGASDSSEIEFERTYELRPGSSVGLTVAIDINSVKSDKVDQDNADGDGSVIALAESYVEFDNEKLGKLKLGFADTATDEIDAINLTRTKAVGDADVKDWNEKFFLRFQGTDELGDLRWGDFVDGTIAGETVNLIGYTSPTIGGFTFDAAWGGDDYWDAALRYSRVWADTLWIKGGIGYWNNTNEAPGDEEPTEDEGWAGSVALRHVPSGLNIAFSYGTQSHTDNCAEVGAITGQCRGDDEFYYVRGGIVRNDLSSWGFTSFYGEYYRGLKNLNESDDAFATLSLDDVPPDEFEVSDSDATVWGFGVVQEVKAVAAEIYVGYRRYQLDVDLIGENGESVAARGIEDFSAVVAGATLKF